MLYSDYQKVCGTNGSAGYGADFTLYLTSRRKFLWNNSMSPTVYSNLPRELAVETPSRTVQGGDHVFLLFDRVYWAKPATLGVCSASHVFGRTATPNPKGVSELYVPSK
jgi:hypothetical protein